jgi:hypothetical protein
MGLFREIFAAPIFASHRLIAGTHPRSAERRGSASVPSFAV